MLFKDGHEYKDIVIIGAGPTGLGAAWRLHELMHNIHEDEFSWLLVDSASIPGGLASSVIDDMGFTWDIGGHIAYSHYAYFDAVLDLLDDIDWLYHVRERWIWMYGRFVPYPMQRNLHYLPKDVLIRCFNSLLEVHTPITHNKTPSNLHEWLLQNFGRALADIFFIPYNFKMWAHNPKEISCTWTQYKSGSTRHSNVPLTDIKRIFKNIIMEKDDFGWDNNTVFPYPMEGGTGAVWEKVYKKLPKHNVSLGSHVVKIDTKTHTITFKDGVSLKYNNLISTVPLNEFLKLIDDQPLLSSKSSMFKFSTNHIIGLGIAGDLPIFLKNKYSINFPELSIPFYRVSVLSNHSPYNVPDTNHYSLLCEVSESKEKEIRSDCILEEVEHTLRNIFFIKNNTNIVSRWYHRLHCGYPVPFLARDQVLAEVQTKLRDLNIWSRGRLGGWKYEVSNQDQAFMQGVEAVDNIIFGAEEITYFYPEINERRILGRRKGSVAKTLRSLSAPRSPSLMLRPRTNG